MKSFNFQISVWTIGALALLLAVSYGFYSFPGVDLWAARELYLGNGKFLWNDNSLSHLIDGPVDLFLKFGFLISFVCYLVFLILKIKLPASVQEKLNFIYLTVFCSELLIINFILKNHWGRARPHQLAEFGGPEHAHFTPAWQYAHECLTNCSFTSGHAGMAASVLLLVVFVPQRWRALYLLVAVAFAVLAGFIRMAHGAHFLSDVTLSVLIVLATAMVVKDCLKISTK